MLSYNGGQKKQILKDQLINEFPGVKDDGVKRGFSIPLGKWIREDLRSVFEEKLFDSSYSNFGFETKAIEEMLNSHIKENKDFKWPLFTLYALPGN